MCYIRWSSSRCKYSTIMWSNATCTWLKTHWNSACHKTPNSAGQQCFTCTENTRRHSNIGKLQSQRSSVRVVREGCLVIHDTQLSSFQLKVVFLHWSGHIRETRWSISALGLFLMLTLFLKFLCVACFGQNNVSVQRDVNTERLHNSGEKVWISELEVTLNTQINVVKRHVFFTFSLAVCLPLRQDCADY